MKKKKIIILIVILVTLVLIATVAGVTYYLVVKLPEKKEKEEQLKQYYEFYAQKLVEYDNENKAYEDFEVDIAFIGDSLTAGYDVERYYSEYLVTNRGIGGETTYGLRDRLAVSVLDLKPKICVMLIGGNNPETMFDDYEDMLIAFQESIPETKIVLVSHAPTSGPDWGKRNELFTYNNVKIKLFAQKYGYEFVDIYTPMFDLETGEMNAEYTVDGAHFTVEGFGVVTDAIKPVVDKLLADSFVN